MNREWYLVRQVLFPHSILLTNLDRGLISLFREWGPAPGGDRHGAENVFAVWISRRHETIYEGVDSNGTSSVAFFPLARLDLLDLAALDRRSSLCEMRKPERNPPG